MKEVEMSPFKNKVMKLLRACGFGLAAVLVLVIYPATAFAAPGDAGPWQTDDVVPDSLAWTSATTYNGYIYLVSGANNSIYTDTVYFAKLGSNGSIGPWGTTATAPYIGSSISVITHNGYMYYMAGYNGTSVTSDAYYAPIHPDGTLGNWTATTSTADAWSGASVAANGNYIYLLGGNNGVSNDSSVTYAPINSDGSLGSWAATSSLPAGLAGGGVAVHNGHIYYVGGNNGSRTDTVYYADLNANGSVGSWQSTSSLPEERESAGLVEYNGYLFAIGGYNNSVITDTVYAAPINSDGTVGVWAATTSLPSVRTVAGVTSYNGFVYNLAGLDAGSNPTNTAYYAALAGYAPPVVQDVSAIAVTGERTAIDVLQEATTNPDPNTLTIVSGPAHGSAQVSGSKIAYTSQNGYMGSDSLTYQVCSLSDSSVCSQAELKIRVMPRVPNTGIAPSGRSYYGYFILLGLFCLGMISGVTFDDIKKLIR